MGKIDDILKIPKSVSFLPECKWQTKNGSVTYCEKELHELYGKPCSKRCNESESE